MPRQRAPFPQAPEESLMSTRVRGPVRASRFPVARHLRLLALRLLALRLLALRLLALRLLALRLLALRLGRP